MVLWSGRYQDRCGSEEITIDNDGDLIVVVIRSVRFVGDFDHLEPTGGLPAPELGFTFDRGSLCSYVLEWDAPLPVVVADSPRDGLLRCRLALGEPGGRYGGLTSEELTMTLHIEGTTYTTDRGYGSFEDALEDIHRKLPSHTYLKACITCAWSDYSPGRTGLIGMACFRGVKDAYRKVSSKWDLFAIFSRRTQDVQETYLCPEFERRTKGAGYRGSFPNQQRILQ
jgi:hypothetical protein